MDSKISFYTFSEVVDEGTLRAIKNVYNFVDELVVRLNKKNIGLSEIKKIDEKKKIKVINKDFTCFADIRNFCLANTLGDWILTLDSDEIFSAEFLKNIRKYVKNGDVSGYKIKRIHFYKTKNEAPDPFLHLRFFKKNHNTKYSGLVHELLSGVEKIKKINNNKEIIYHFNSFSDMLKKNQKYRTILKKELHLAQQKQDEDLIKLAKFRLWSNVNIDDPRNFSDRKKMDEIMGQFKIKLKKVLRGRTNYHEDLYRLEKLD